MSPETWESFFLAAVGAAAALGGLLFVALSINVRQILEMGGLADRALQALTVLVGILILGLLLLMPNQAPEAIGIEVVVVTVLVLAMGTWLGIRGIRHTDPQYRRRFITNVVTFEAAQIPTLAGGILLIVSGDEIGIYLVAIGICLGFLKAVSDAWVFLIEINR